jgi:tetratricopeptide (TPR) repeat protein
LYSGGAEDLYRLAQAMMKRRKFDDAIAVLELNARLFPRDLLSLRTLTEAYLAKGDTVAYWKTSWRTLAISPHDRTARHAVGLDR